MTPFPVTESTLSAIHLGDFLRDRYNFTPSVTCRLIRTGMNHLYLVTDDTQSFVFRVYTHQWRSKLEIEEEISLLNHLKANLITVSYPVQDIAKQFVHELNAPEGLRYGVMFSFAPGKKNAAFDEQKSFSIGVQMANMHRATIGLAINRASYNQQTLLHDSYRSTKAFFHESLEEMVFVKDLSAFLTSIYADVNEENIRKGVVHLDIWFDNMHFNEDEITFFDFDFCGNGWLVHDVAYFLLQLYNTNPDESQYALKATAFVNGYESITPLSEEEKRLIPYVSLSVYLFYLGQQCEKFDTWSNIFLNEDHLKRFTRMMKRWMSYHRLDVP